MPTFRLSPIPTTLKALLDANAYFSDITVLLETKGDIENEIARALGVLTQKGGKIGVAVVILAPKASIKDPAPGPILDPLTLTIAVFENVIFNTGADGTGKPALQIVELIMRLLHFKIPTATNSALLATGYRLTASDPLTYEIDFKLKLALTPEA
ncbi:MAG: hypothetical protein HY343_08685 [Lentisphaerae bacterium]|nr:hypothetical protein [Lentisphaerota bacterium]